MFVLILVHDLCIISKEGRYKDMTVGEKIRQLRKEKNMSQADLSYATGLTKGAISMYELNARNPKFETLEILADFFNVDMNYLLGKSEYTDIVADDTERLLFSMYRALNEEGKKKVAEYMSDLVASGKYSIIG